MSTSTLRTIPDSYAECRSLRHAWVPKKYKTIEPNKTARLLGFNQHIGRALVCDRCRVLRVDMFSRRKSKRTTSAWVKVGTRYGYPDDYALPKVTSEEVHNEFMRRWLPQALR